MRMGQYMKKSKLTSDVAIIEVVSLSPQCSLGVRTRARTLALQRQQDNQKSQSLVDESSLSYLELRSRRLEKPPLLGDAKKQSARAHSHGYCGHRNSSTAEELCGGVGNPSPKISWSSSRYRVRSMESVDSVAWKGDEGKEQNDVGLQTLFGDNNLDFEVRDRSTRESTPCSLIPEPDTLSAPGSTTKRTSSTAMSQRVRNDMRRSIPMANEMEEFFVSAEEQQRRIFIEKYNFDFVSDSPLPGRYDWVQVMPLSGDS